MDKMHSDNEITPFAVTTHRNKELRFGIKRDDRRRHTYVIGKTGMGKSNLLEIMAISDIQAGRGVAIVDPHGEFAEKMLDFIPEERIDDVIYFNPADLEFPIALNVVGQVDANQRHLITDGLVGIFEKLWATSWGPRLEYILRMTILTLLEVPGATLLGVMRLLVDDVYREKAVRLVTDPVVKQFWVNEFGRYAGSFSTEAVAPIQNKVGQFVANAMIRNIIGQEETAFDFREIMDKEKILIMNLSKGRVGEGGSQLLGAMMITKLQLAAMSRVDMDEKDRKDFYLYVDEFQNFATQSFAEILSEARKYRLDLILAHQYIAQMSEEVRDAVFGNVGTIISFRVGSADGDDMEEEFAPRYAVNDLVNIPKFHILLKLMIDGVSSPPFSALVLPPFPKPEKSFREEIIRRSREKYATPREDVDRAIREWAGPSDDLSDMFEAICSRCGAETLVPFEPDDKRAVYCKKCMVEVQKKKQEAAESRKEKPDSNVQKELARQKKENTASFVVKPTSVKDVPEEKFSSEKKTEASDKKEKQNEASAEKTFNEKKNVESTEKKEENTKSISSERRVGRPSLSDAVNGDKKKRQERKGPNIKGLRLALAKAMKDKDEEKTEAIDDET